jgi:hypothetical protein
MMKTQNFSPLLNQLAIRFVCHRFLFSAWRSCHVTGRKIEAGFWAIPASRGWQPALLARALQNPQPSFIITITTPDSIIVPTSS